MKTIVACFLGLIALVTSAGGSAVYADALEAGCLALSVIAPGAGTNSVESLDDAHCAFYSDAADNCIVNVQPQVNVQPEPVDQWSPAVSELDPAATAPAVRFMDAIAVAVVQTVTIAASGLDAGDRDASSSVQPIPAAQPVFDAETTPGAIAPGQSADAIVVAVVQTVTIAASGLDAGDRQASSSGRPMAQPVFDAKTTSGALAPGQSADAIVVAVVQSVTVAVPAHGPSGDEPPPLQLLPPGAAPRSMLQAENDGPR